MDEGNERNEGNEGDGDGTKLDSGASQDGTKFS